MSDEAADPVAETLVGVLLFFGVFAFGSSEDWARCVLLALSSAIFCRSFSQGRTRLAGPFPAFGVILAILTTMAMLQSLRIAPSIDVSRPWGPFSISRSLAARAAIDWGTATLLFLGASSTFRTGPSRRRLCWTLLCLGAALSLAGMAQATSGNTSLLGLREVVAPQVPFGPFPNKNHAATILLMALACGAGILASDWDRAAAFLNERRTDEFVGRTGVVMSLLAVTLLGLVACRSRAAVAIFSILLALGGGATASNQEFSKPLRHLALAVMAVVLVGITAALATQGAALLGQFPAVKENSFVLRLAMAHDAIRMIGQFPIFGVGLGNYRAASPLFHDSRLGAFFVDHVHCDPLELAAEAGIPAALGFYSLIILTIARSGRKPFESLAPALGMAACAAVLHQLVDFPTRIPGVMLVFVVIVAAMSGSAPPGLQPSPASRATMAAVSVIAWGFICVPRLAAARLDLLSAQSFPPSTSYYQDAAVRWQPTYRRHWDLATSYVKLAEANPAARRALWRTSLGHISAARKIEPYNPDALRLEASVRAALGDSP